MADFISLPITNFSEHFAVTLVQQIQADLRPSEIDWLRIIYLRLVQGEYFHDPGLILTTKQTPQHTQQTSKQNRFACMPDV